MGAVMFFIGIILPFTGAIYIIFTGVTGFVLYLLINQLLKTPAQKLAIQIILGRVSSGSKLYDQNQ